jgi:hypothetical protein
MRGGSAKLPGVVPVLVAAAAGAPGVTAPVSVVPAAVPAIFLAAGFDPPRRGGS